MAMTKTMIKSRAVSDASTARIVAHVNEELCADNDSGMFVTLFAAILDLRTGDLISTNAGHNPPLLKRGDGTLVRLNRRDGPVVGSLPGMEFGQTQTRLLPGDTLLLYTDGVTEADDGSDRLFSAPRLESLLASSRTVSMRSLVTQVRDAVVAFEAGAARADDMTLLALRFNGPHGATVSDGFEAVIPNDKTRLIQVTELFGKHAARWGIPERVQTRVLMGLDELITNVIDYGYNDQDAHEIRIKVTRTPGRLLVTLSDDARPFNPLSAPAPDLSPDADEREIGGLGIHLCREMFDQLTYERCDGRNVVTLEALLGTEAGTDS
jgi:sigma-B regulation protein RsbU (phosphoserine phosphatase)